jgi:hypothetical protein
MKQIRLIGFICKAKDLTTRLNEEWEKLEKIKKKQLSYFINIILSRKEVKLNEWKLQKHISIG